MGLFSKDIKTMDDLCVRMLRDVYYAENQILKALPDMVEKASDPQLREAFEQHLGETENQVRRLEKVFQLHGVTPKGVNCPAIDGILEEADEISGETADNEVLDADKIKSILKLKVYDVIPLGSGSEKQNFMVIEIKRSFVSAQLSGHGEDNTHFTFIVKANSALNR